MSQGLYIGKTWFAPEDEALVQTLHRAWETCTKTKPSFKFHLGSHEKLQSISSPEPKFFFKCEALVQTLQRARDNWGWAVFVEFRQGQQEIEII